MTLWILIAAAQAGPLGAGLDEPLAKGAKNPLTSGQPAHFEWPDPKFAHDRSCDLKVPENTYEITATVEQICIKRRYFRWVDSAGREPDAYLFESWFESATGATPHFTPTGSVDFYTTCGGTGQMVKVFEEKWEGCTPNDGVLTEDTSELVGMSSVPPAPMIKRGIKRKDFAMPITD